MNGRDARPRQTGATRQARKPTAAAAHRTTHTHTHARTTSPSPHLMLLPPPPHASHLALVGHSCTQPVTRAAACLPRPPRQDISGQTRTHRATHATRLPAPLATRNARAHPLTAHHHQIRHQKSVSLSLADHAWTLVRRASGPRDPSNTQEARASRTARTPVSLRSKSTPKRGGRNTHTPAQ